MRKYRQISCLIEVSTGAKEEDSNKKGKREARDQHPVHSGREGGLRSPYAAEKKLVGKAEN